ncbi:Thyroid peroxidase precursor, putative [Pediculus humanus corporis]|uniref:Thyroid peroxidase precursor, putative n=1 Tax=Pediculus humanus subsp. corporis TaxID=121224 RepID=E0VZU0_PEDHC|nr:Thyroid peroxidase precursor, putative [Pediculus humanus corporis]EEB18896.1 Thyroid peroxidase precursor, putative [Pediculus humanus corporis]
MEGRELATMSEDDFHCRKPEIVEEPRDVEVSFGGSASFHCKVDGDPAPEVIWLRNSNEINANDGRHSILKDGTLMIESTLDEDLGTYECVAKSPLGQIKSKQVRMDKVRTTREGKPHFERTPLDWSANIGDTVQLVCSANGDPRPHISWYFGESHLSNSHKYRIEDNGVLIIFNAQPQDAGIYRCTAANSLGVISSVSRLRVNVAPTFSTHPENLTLKSGEMAELVCAADGEPVPSISWYKGGRLLATGGRTYVLGQKLRIEHVKESDSGLYVCRADNRAGQAETTARILVKDYRERLPPKFIHTPYNLDVPAGSTIEIPCKADGEPAPVMVWRKDGNVISESKGHYRLSSHGSLYIHSVSFQDAGTYECSAVNDFGKVVANGVLKVKGKPQPASPGDKFVQKAFEEASRDIDHAVDNTLKTFVHRPRNGPPLSAGELMRLVRFPNAAARQVARAAEVYERTLYLIRKHVESGMKVKPEKDFSYKDILSPEKLTIIANLSGCMIHRPAINCSDMCFHNKYRTIDGTCNNMKHPMWGASLTGFDRILSPVYEDGFSMPVGWTKSIKYHGFSKPSARLISTRLIRTDEITPDDHVTHMLMQWGQFLDHDLDHAIPSVSSESWGGINCKKSCDYAAPCYPIEVPPNDPRVTNRRCIDVVRSSAICGSGQTSVLWADVQPREQINQLTAFIDASQVYGFSTDVANILRNFTNDYGRLREGISYPNGKPLLPFAENHPNDCRRDPGESEIECFIAGDIRSNEQIGLLAMHTIWFREHNRIASELRHLNTHWDGDTIYYEARKIVGAEMQHITYNHWLPLVLGEKGMEMLGKYKSYDPNISPGISNVFATAALRFGHSLINPVLERLNSSFQPIPEGHLLLQKAFFSPWRLVDEGGVDPLMRGLFTAPAKLKTPTQNLNSELTEHLFEFAHAVALDLAAINIQRGRDHALPEYNAFRKYCNLTVAETFDDLRGEISSQSVRNELEALYGHPGNIDVWVGGILEDQIDGAKVGPTFRCLLVEQFKRLRDGDRFWYENNGVFKPEQLTEIKQSSLARVLCDNGDDIRDVTRNVFVLPRKQGGYLPCAKIPQIDLRFWTECSHDCQGPRIFDGISNSISRTRRSSSGSSMVKKRQTNSQMNQLNELNRFYNEVQMDDEVNEDRIEGMETVLEEFQKTLKQIKRKMRKLSYQCQMNLNKKNSTQSHGSHHHNQCNDNGHKRINGEHWSKDACTQCVCQEKQITCTKILCPKMICSKPETKPDECCPVCPKDDNKNQ